MKNDEKILHFKTSIIIMKWCVNVIFTMDRRILYDKIVRQWCLFAKWNRDCRR